MRALAVEDDPRIARDLVAAISAAGFRVETAVDGETAWFLGDTEDYDLIVLDLGLPKMDGLAALKRWRANGRETPVLILSARGTWSERVEGIDAGADDYLPKPFRMEELIARARALVRRSAGRGGAVQEIGSLVIDATRMSVSLRGLRSASARSSTAFSPISRCNPAGSPRPQRFLSMSTATTTPARPTRSRRLSPGFAASSVQA
jgi:two-component system OmpR family response regulator